MKAAQRRTFPEQSGADSLSYCADLWWWFHEADAQAGLRSSLGGQLVALETVISVHHEPKEPNFNISAAKKRAKIYRAMMLLPEPQYGVLRVWYTQRQTNPGDVAVAAAHKAFYEARGDS